MSNASGRNFYEHGDAYVRGKLTASDVTITAGGSLQHTASGSIARTNTTATPLFTLPANAVIVDVRVYIPSASNAGTSATISVGWTATGYTDILNTVDVKGSGTGMVQSGAKTTLGSIGASPQTVEGIYAESGTASSAGGPFTVYVDYLTS